MGSICGIYSPKNPTQAGRQILERMLSALDPSGGSAQSFIDLEAGVALGHVQQFDTAAESRAQVSTWEENDLTVATLDGFIFDESKRRPERDLEYRTGAARIVAQSLEQNAAGFPEELYGHFGMATWSRTSRTLRLARDPLGAKTLYCFRDAATGLSVFASQLKGILAHPAVSRRVDCEALAGLMAFGYMPASLGLIAGLEKLFPGEVLELDSHGAVITRRYWKMPPYSPQQVDSSELVNAARHKVLDCFWRHVYDQEDVGVFLSGGVDSTIALGVLKLLGVPKLRGYAMGFRFGSPRLAEDLAWAERAADALGVQCQAVAIEQGHDPVRLLTSVWRHFDDPVLSPNAYSRFLLAKAAQEDGIRMCIGGSSAGAMFGVTSDVQVAKLHKKLGELEPLALMTQRFNRIFPYEEISDLLVDAPKDPRQIGFDVVKRYASDVEAESVGDFMHLAAVRMRGLEKSIATQDRSATLAGVDMRQPFRDTLLFEFCRSIPLDLKGRGGGDKSKYILKTAFSDVLPDEIARRKKIGYPSYYWMNGEIDVLMRRLLSRQAIEQAGLFRPEKVRQVLEEDRISGKKSAGKRTWALLATQAWHAFHVEGRDEL